MVEHFPKILASEEKVTTTVLYITDPLCACVCVCGGGGHERRLLISAKIEKPRSFCFSSALSLLVQFQIYWWVDVLRGSVLMMSVGGLLIRLVFQ